jgi:DNA-binding transcriptional ArsR family regulator
MVRELAEPFAMTRVAVSKHLRVLEKARLISRTVDGRIHRCALRAARRARCAK